MSELKLRGFEVVCDEQRKHSNIEIELPVRGDNRSAGYDIKTPVTVTLQPNERTVVWTDIKSYMQDNEVLELHVRSSIGIKRGVILSNITGIIDSSYYSNEGNDGNIGLALWNTSDKEVILEAGERICQGIFKTYLTADNDICISDKRVGGIGSSGK
ncbi:MAG: dUTP diphosphatase [Romboutsia sp.]|nr:dUTP diphosphatase [Romboutsia sp.]